MKHIVLLIFLTLLNAVGVSQTRYIDQVFMTVNKTSNVVYGWNWSLLPTPEDTIGTQMGSIKLHVDSLNENIYTPAGDATICRPVILLSPAGSFHPSTFTGLPLYDGCMELIPRFIYFEMTS